MADRRGTIRDVSSCPSEQPTVNMGRILEVQRAESLDDGGE
jgi:hypothetical protein